MPQCAVVGCNNTHRRTKGGSVKYHRFPGDSVIRHQWLKACGKSVNNCATARICSRHFSEASYERDVQHEILGLPTRSRLKRGALPDQNLPNDFLNEEAQPESAIDILLAVGLVPANKSNSNNGGLPEDLNKMQIMEDVREGCDTNPPSSPGHAEQGEDSSPLQEIKKDATLSNGLVKADIKSEIELSEVIKQEQFEKRSNDEMNDKEEENSSSHSINSENNEKRKLDQEHTSIKRLKTEPEDSFIARDKIIVEFMELAECNNLDQIQNLSDQIFSEIKALNDLARDKEREWNQLLHMKKLKEELLIRLQRKRQVLIINDSDLNDFQPENNGQQSLLKCNQKVNMLRELRAANIEKLKQRNMLQSTYKQKPMLDVQSIIADYRQRHPETVPRRGGSLTIGQSSGMDNHESGLSGSLNGFAKLSQSEKSELQNQMHNIKPPPPYPEVTVHPVTSTSSVTPSNSLLHGILTKAPVKQNHSNGNSNTPVNGKSSFSPTLARLLTAPEKAAIQSSTSNMLGGSLLNASNMSISDIFSGSKVRNEITITPLGGQFETATKRELIDEDEQTDRLVIDEALDNSSTRIKEDNRSEDGEEVPQCQGCNQQPAQFVCAGCGNQWYCSRDCQVAAWDDHSELCSG
uniref:THAP-type domain-containing protein n=1 Tax=Dendroctonus ponderosae TaxID=77166 RepID=A0AAR5PDX6_DENPD